MKSERRVTLKEIAERTGVSVGTVHCAIYGKKGVSEKTRKIILEEVKKSNFHLNENASLLKRGVQNVMVVLPKMEGEDGFYFRGIWEGVRKAAEELSRFHFQFRYEEVDCHLDEISQALARVYDEEGEHIQGLITVSDNQEANIWASRFGKLGIPTVLISSYQEAAKNVFNVKIDHNKAGKLAGEFLYHTLRDRPGKVLVLTGNTNIYSNRKYVNAFLEYMEGHCPWLQMACVPGFGADAISQAVCQALEEETFIGAFICNARNTMQFCKIAENYGQCRDMIVVGTDVFHELSPYFENGVLTAAIYQYNREQGIRAVEMLHQLLSGTARLEMTEEMPIGLVMKYNYEFYVS